MSRGCHCKRGPLYRHLATMPGAGHVAQRGEGQAEWVGEVPIGPDAPKLFVHLAPHNDGEKVHTPSTELTLK